MIKNKIKKLLGIFLLCNCMQNNIEAPRIVGVIVEDDAPSIIHTRPN